MLLTVLLIVQSGAVGEEDKGSKQFLASPSMTMRGHFSTLASWIAQRMADASALRGEHVGVDLAHTFNTSPLWSLATTAIALLCLPMAASVLSLIQPRGGGFHLWREVTMLEGGGTLEDLTKEYSASLWWISLMDAWVSMTPPWCTNWFLTRQISPRTKDMFRVVIQLSSRGHGACGGSVSSFMISPLVEHEWSSGLKPQQQENHNALAIEHWRNRWTVDSISWWHRGHKSSRLAILRWRFSLVGSMFAPILHISILTLSGALILLIFFQSTSEFMARRCCSVTVRNADLTVKFPFGFWIQMSLSGFELKEIGIMRMAFEDSASKIFWMRLAFYVRVSRSMRWDTIRGFLGSSWVLGLGRNPSIQGTQGSCHTLMDAPSPIRWHSPFTY